MTKREAQRLNQQESVLLDLGFTVAEAEALRRISMTLHAWHERECGNGHGCIERDEHTQKTYWRSALGDQRRYRIPDRETGAQKRLDAIMNRINSQRLQPGTRGTALGYYIQTDPRGAALYILRPDDVPAGADVQSYYYRGICVY